MTKKNKNPNIIDVVKAIEIFEAYGLNASQFNDYQIRMFEEETGVMWDWFHTTGSLCSFKNHLCCKVGVIKNAEDVALHIKKSQ